MSSVQQDTIDCEYLVYFEPKKKLKMYEIDIMQFFSADATIFLKIINFFLTMKI